MQRQIFTSILFFLCLSYVSAQYYEDKDISSEPRKIVKRFETETWKTAFTVPEQQLHLSLLAPIRYGILPKVELQTFLGLWAYATPNIYVKKNWYADRWVISSKHGFVYPTQGLKIFRKDDRDHTINKGAIIPQIFTFQNELIVSYVLNPTCDDEIPFGIATGRLGLDVSVTGNRDKSFNRMTFFSFYHRTASFYGDKVWYAGLQLDGGLWQKIYLSTGADVYSIDFGFNGLEVQGNLIYHYNQKLSLSAGVKFIYTKNPIEKEKNYAPMLDVCYRFGRKGTWKKGLLKK